MRITYYVCVCVYLCAALSIQHAMRMPHIVICGLYGSTIFFTLFHAWHDFRREAIEQNSEF
jgi:hypothetical protein